MPSTKQLAFDQTKFDRYIQGDLGIADLIYNQEVKPIISQAKTPQDIALLQPLIVPNKKTGLWALERTFIQTTFELHRPLIELNKHLLELFGHLEYIVACISGGANPFNLPSSYANAFKQNIADMSKFTTKFEPDNLNSAGQSQSPPPVLPLIIFLGRFDAIGQKLSSNNEEIDKFKLDTNNYIWPQYQNKDEFTTEQTDLINQETESVDEPYKSEIRNSRSDSFDDEWDDMDSKNQLKTNFNYLPPNLKKYYRPMTVDYQNQQVEIDLEEDYNIEVKTVFDDNQIPTYTIIASLKESVSLANQSSLGNNNQPQTPDPIPSQSYAKAAKFFFKKTLKVLLKKYIPVIAKTKELLVSSDKYVGDLMISYMLQNYEMFDPELATKSDSDPIKQKYFVNGNFVMDGIANMNVDKFNNYLQINNQKLSIKPGFYNVENQQSSTLMILNLIALSTNYLNQMLEVYSSFLLGLFKVKNIPTLLPGFLSYQSFRNVLLKNNIITMLGGQGINLLTIPCWLPSPNSSNEMERTFKQIMTLLINGLIEISNVVYNQPIAVKLPPV